MRKLVPAFLFALFALLASLGVASAQTPAQINTLNIAVTPTCGEQSLSNWAGKPFYLLYEDYTGALCTGATFTGTVTATTTATASSTPTAISAGTNMPLNENLFSSLFVQPTFAGTPVDGTHGLPTNCIAGCSGGPADESAITFGTTPIFTGGVYQTTATSNPLTTGQAGIVQMTANRAFFVNLRNSSGTEIATSTNPISDNVAQWDGTALGAPSNYGTSPGAVAVPGVNAYVTNSVTVTATDLSTNLAQVGGAAVALGQTTMSASMPVAIASNQSSLGVALNTTPSLANGNGVVPTQGGSVLSVSNGLPMQAVSQYPLSSTPITASAIGTTAATTATLAATSGKTTYICTMSIRANATAAATGNATVTGTITGTLNYTQWTAPLASGLGVTEELFMPCVPASGTNTSIAVVSAAPGSGGTVSVTVSGYQQ